MFFGKWCDKRYLLFLRCSCIRQSLCANDVHFNILGNRNLFCFLTIALELHTQAGERTYANSTETFNFKLETKWCAKNRSVVSHPPTIPHICNRRWKQLCNSYLSLYNHEANIIIERIQKQTQHQNSGDSLTCSCWKFKNWKLCSADGRENLSPCFWHDIRCSKTVNSNARHRYRRSLNLAIQAHRHTSKSLLLSCRRIHFPQMQWNMVHAKFYWSFTRVWEKYAYIHTRIHGKCLWRTCTSVLFGFLLQWKFIWIYLIALVGTVKCPAIHFYHINDTCFNQCCQCRKNYGIFAYENEPALIFWSSGDSVVISDPLSRYRAKL